MYEHFYTAVAKVKKSSTGFGAGKAAAAVAASEGGEVEAPVDGAETKNTVEEYFCLMEAVRSADGGELNLDNFVSSAPTTGTAATKPKARGMKPPRKSVAPGSKASKPKKAAAPRKTKAAAKEEWSSDEEEAELASDSDGGADSDGEEEVVHKALGTTSRTRKPLAEAN